MPNFMKICPGGNKSSERRTEGQKNGHDEANHRAIWQKRIRIALILRVLLVERTLDSGLPYRIWNK
jgi:hypothetical protein